MTEVDGPFRASEAVPAGRVTRGVIAGPRMTRLFPNVHVPTGLAAGPDDLAGRVRAALLYVHGPPAVVGGFAAAELLGASCGPPGFPVELVVGRRRIRSRAGLAIRQDVLAEDDVVEVEGVRVTSPERTAWDLVRRLGPVDAVVALDALARVGRFSPTALLTRSGAGARGSRRVAAAVVAADPRAASPPETRIRLLLAERGLRPTPQVEVRDGAGVFVGRVDLGWEQARVAVEYQGDQHRSDRAQWRRDQARLAALAALGWLVILCTADDLRRPGAFLARVRTALAERLP